MISGISEKSISESGMSISARISRVCASESGFRRSSSCSEFSVKQQFRSQRNLVAGVHCQDLNG